MLIAVDTYGEDIIIVDDIENGEDWLENQASEMYETDSPCLGYIIDLTGPKPKIHKYNMMPPVPSIIKVKG